MPSSSHEPKTPRVEKPRTNTNRTDQSKGIGSLAKKQPKGRNYFVAPSQHAHANRKGPHAAVNSRQQERWDVNTKELAKK